jgi:hypothetical protein
MTKLGDFVLGQVQQAFDLICNEEHHPNNPATIYPDSTGPGKIEYHRRTAL